MKYIDFKLEIYDSQPELVIFGEQEELYDKYMADPSYENQELFLSSLEDEIALNIGFTVESFAEGEYEDD